MGNAIDSVFSAANQRQSFDEKLYREKNELVGLEYAQGIQTQAHRNQGHNGVKQVLYLFHELIEQTEEFAKELDSEEEMRDALYDYDLLWLSRQLQKLSPINQYQANVAEWVKEKNLSIDTLENKIFSFFEMKKDNLSQVYISNFVQKNKGLVKRAHQVDQGNVFVIGADGKVTQKSSFAVIDTDSLAGDEDSDTSVQLTMDTSTFDWNKVIAPTSARATETNPARNTESHIVRQRKDAGKRLASIDNTPRKRRKLK
uniref:Uncharacterized protein n=1 Tax=Percolomonas cosmopolitus TaxID=63605 RepID=A0A7S1KNF3_9EUKA|mmetsp:Transcript_168/g.593  ORF Transcript_168/g.593 Transcript_168/m.593 type:complete len:257 (+) Transcript_168:177-947(+)|eukprot:CAMPEP_0117444450 /NCGR_PEP_ID=MMETSP0759-20121206/5247_1 /TAXON_ID=63605 /ORGANISM="Percolomonas cosmopolitus, Strain WS" /LENGTH=256 /DNA_ID=CAMNT_0005236517 /DNA_START=126 /DNA_END=896 /DNA_ORIENTATION=+